VSNARLLTHARSTSPFAMTLARVSVSVSLTVSMVTAVVVLLARLFFTRASSPFAVTLAPVSVSVRLTVSMVTAVVVSFTRADRARVSRPLAGARTNEGAAAACRTLHAVVATRITLAASARAKALHGASDLIGPRWLCALY
jgi:hypothetical protein